jgi:prephenate dehydrogenase
MGDILLTNRAAVLARLGRYREGLSELIDLLERGEEAELLAWLAKAHQGYWDYRGYGSLE